MASVEGHEEMDHLDAGLAAGLGVGLGVGLGAGVDQAVAKDIINVILISELSFRSQSWKY